MISNLKAPSQPDITFCVRTAFGILMYPSLCALSEYDKVQLFYKRYEIDDLPNNFGNLTDVFFEPSNKQHLLDCSSPNHGKIHQVYEKQVLNGNIDKNIPGDFKDNLKDNLKRCRGKESSFFIIC